ncbi:Alcohol dehydrogenase cytochrome c subunit precursor [Pigmentiphaga humi]|uniref:Alcohol dehydrogenase cytochrome c subunit n=1 Tax=Pigmentiphaga humi TaxID=2478468 RepID=A0A3P4B1Z4_9BURK|nr:cytochrome c [Pigmentiphaga humi]VCU70082.1 Alcohol dehydrogenase cytochrome c subunit precursor [Pigmentiphaga humi]
MRSKHFRSRGAVVALVILLLVAAAVAAAILGNRDDPPDRAPQQVQATAEQLRLGRYLARAADCAACHQTAQGAAYAGGFPLETPFGTVYGTNITPDPDHGIGRWTADEFYGALTRGKAPHGRNLYPAMPYTAYHDIARADADLIYAYLMNVRPSAQANKKPDIPFPLNLRILMSGWNLLFFDKDPLPAASQGESQQWVRGRYLSNVLGHCGECHTPRGALGQVKRDEWLQGYALGRFEAPSLTPRALAERGWNPADLQRFLRTGLAPQGIAADEMYPVILHSTQYLGDDDLAAMSAFMLGDHPPPPVPAPQARPEDGPPSAGRRVYLNTCAACHGIDGNGHAPGMPPLADNSTVRLESPRNLLLSILDGLPGQRLPDGTEIGEMPGFARRLSDDEVAQLTNYLRAAWGGRPGEVAAGDVAKLREGK